MLPPAPLSKHRYPHYVQKQYCYPFETKQQISLPYSRLLNNYKLETLILYTTFQFQNMMPVQISAWFLNPNPTNCCTTLNQKSSLHFGLIMRSSIYIAFQQAQLFGGIHEYLGSRAGKAGEKNGRQDTRGWPKQASLLKGYYLCIRGHGQMARRTTILGFISPYSSRKFGAICSDKPVFAFTGIRSTNSCCLYARSLNKSTVSKLKCTTCFVYVMLAPV